MEIKEKLNCIKEYLKDYEACSEKQALACDINIQNIHIDAMYVKDNELVINEIISETSVLSNNDIISAIFDYLLDTFYDFREKYLPKQSKETMWIARDVSGYICLHEIRPILTKSKDEYISKGKYMVLNSNMFPEVTFENSPKEVELKIK